MPITARPYITPKRQSSGGASLGSVANLVMGLMDKGKANKAQEAQAAKEKGIDDILRRSFQDRQKGISTPQSQPQGQRMAPQGQPVQRLQQQPQQGPQQPTYSQRMQNAEKEMFEQYPRQGMSMRQDRMKQEALGKKNEAELANKLITNKDLTLKYQNSQHEVIGDILSNVTPENYQVAKKMIREIDEDMNLPETHNDAKQFLSAYPKMKEAIIKRNNLSLEGKVKQVGIDKTKHEMRLADKKFEFEKGKDTTKKLSDKGDGLRKMKKDIVTDKRLDRYREISGSMQTIENIWAERPPANDNSFMAQESRASIDQGLITTYNKILDPGSVVRESEYARTPEGIALINRLEGIVPKLTQGGAGLTDKDRTEIYDIAKRINRGASKQYAGVLGTYYKDAKNSGYDMEYVFSPKDLNLIESELVEGSKKTEAKPNFNNLSTEEANRYNQLMAKQADGTIGN
jgi:hypothetical protein